MDLVAGFASLRADAERLSQMAAAIYSPAWDDQDKEPGRG